MSNEASAAKQQPSLPVETREPSTGPIHIELFVEDGKTLSQVALPSVLSKGPLPRDRTVVIKNVDNTEDITFSFPTVYDRNVFENPSKLVEPDQPKRFLLKPGDEASFVVREELGLIGSHEDEDNRIYKAGYPLDSGDPKM